MKQHILCIVLCLFGFATMGQYPGNANDWVEYNKTYYKFGVDEDGIYRLSQADLLAA